jgi:hypothetical protein
LFFPETHSGGAKVTITKKSGQNLRITAVRMFTADNNSIKKFTAWSNIKLTTTPSTTASSLSTMSPSWSTKAVLKVKLNIAEFKASFLIFGGIGVRDKILRDTFDQLGDLGCFDVIVWWWKVTRHVIAVEYHRLYLVNCLLEFVGGLFLKDALMEPIFGR